MTNSSNSQLNPGAPMFTGMPSPSINPTIQTSTTSTMYVGSNKMVLLQTPVAEVTNPRDRSYAMKVGIVFDDGSQKSYLTWRVKDALTLSVDSRKYLSIAAFGSRKRKPKCEVVHIAIQTKHGDRSICSTPHLRPHNVKDGSDLC